MIDPKIHAAGPSGQEGSATPPQSAERILVVDDDRLIVATIGGALRAAGFEVIEAFDSASALTACLSRNPSLALVDYKMPDGDGIQLAQRIAAQTRIPVIFLTAYGNEALVGQAIAAGAMTYLVKPIDPEQIIPVVRVALRRAREMHALQAQTDRLNVAVRNCRQISIATGLVMANLDLNQHDAFERLRLHARSKRSRVEELAGELLRVADKSAGLYSGMATGRPARSAPTEDNSGDAGQ